MKDLILRRGLDGSRVRSRFEGLTNNTRGVIKKIRTAIEEGNKEVATSLLSSSQSLLAKLSKKGIVKAGHASRITSRLAAQVKKLS